MRACASLVAVALSLAPSISPAQQPPLTLTARDVVERIKQSIGVPWTEPTVDTFKDGDPATPVTPRRRRDVAGSGTRRSRRYVDPAWHAHRL